MSDKFRNNALRLFGQQSMEAKMKMLEGSVDTAVYLAQANGWQPECRMANVLRPIWLFSDENDALHVADVNEWDGKLIDRQPTFESWSLADAFARTHWPEGWIDQ